MKKTTSLRAFYWGVKLFEQFAFIKLNAYIYIYKVGTEIKHDFNIFSF